MTRRKGVPVAETITFRCASCDESLTVAAENAGRRGKCKHCQAVNLVPGAPEPATPAPRNTTSEVIKHFFTKVAGVTHDNEDGTSRQGILKECSPGEILTLACEPDNPHSKWAVKVCRDNGEQIGYLSDHIAGNAMGAGWCVSKHIQRDYAVDAWVMQVTGSGKKRRGVNIAVVIGPPGTSRKEVEQYLQQVDLASEMSENDDAAEDTEGGCTTVGVGVVLFVIGVFCFRSGYTMFGIILCFIGVILCFIGGYCIAAMFGGKRLEIRR